MEKGLIFETSRWKVFLADDQTYLGRSVIVLKRKCGDLAELTEEEILDFLGLIKTLESKARRTFGAVNFNYGCLMNDAYQNTPPNPQVHWHFRPRYDREVSFAGEKFVDTDFGHHYLRGTNRILSDNLRAKIISALRSA